MLLAILNRQRRHGSVNIYSANALKAEIGWNKHDFRLGYFEDDGETLSHFLWASSKGEHGPYRIGMLVYNTREQFLELMGLVKGLGDQVHAVRMREPAHIQLQDMVESPFRQYNISEKSEFQADNRASAYWQMRICDLRACIQATHLRCDTVRFNLELHDPIEEYLDDDAPWRGISGDYVVTLGPDSAVEEGMDASLPTLTVSVGAFTRMWLGVRPATGLAVSDELDGPQELLQGLDEALALPVPHPDWDY